MYHGQIEVVESRQRQSFHSQLKLYTPQLVGHLFEELEQLYQKHFETMRELLPKKELYIPYQTSYGYSLQYAGST